MVPIRILVRSFGPVERADIEVKPLTIIIGKNNSGKSLLSQLIYTLLSEISSWRPSQEPREILSQILEFLLGIATKTGIEKPSLKEEAELKNMLLVVREALELHRDRTLKELENLLAKYFTAAPEALVKADSSMAEIEFNSTPIKIELKIARGFGIAGCDLIIDEETMKQTIIELGSKMKEIEDIIWKTKQSVLLLAYMAISLLASLYPRPWYIPAGRAGLIEGFETVFSALVSLTPMAPARGISVPPMPGVAAEFYNTLLRLRGLRGPYSEIIDERFKRILNGDIAYEGNIPAGKPRLVYRFKYGDTELSVNLINASSMVKELAPIYLVTRELINRGDLVIIEEPEAHLHPAAQMKLAEAFIDLVNSGLNLLITTHSDLLLRKLANLIDKGAVKEDDVAVYLLKESDKGFVSEKINILEGIPTFDEIVDELYEEEKEIYFAKLRNVEKR